MVRVRVGGNMSKYKDKLAQHFRESKAKLTENKWKLSFCWLEEQDIPQPPPPSPPAAAGGRRRQKDVVIIIYYWCNINLIIQQLSRLVTLVLLHLMTTHYDNVNVKMIIINKLVIRQIRLSLHQNTRHCLFSKKQKERQEMLGLVRGQFIIPHSPPTITLNNKLPSVRPSGQCGGRDINTPSSASQSITIFQSISCSLSLLIIARFPTPLPPSPTPGCFHQDLII